VRFPEQLAYRTAAAARSWDRCRASPARAVLPAYGSGAWRGANGGVQWNARRRAGDQRREQDHVYAKRDNPFVQVLDGLCAPGSSAARVAPLKVRVAPLKVR
jgi:hypothetical protein